MSPMGGAAARGPVWVRAAVPDSLHELAGAASGCIGLPTRLFWSGPAPDAVRWNLGEPERRRDLYEIVLTDGTLDDIRTIVNRQALVEQWNDLYLPRRVRVEWQPSIDHARAAA